MISTELSGRMDAAKLPRRTKAAELLGQTNLDDLLETILGWDSRDAQIGGDDRTVHPRAELYR